MVVIFWMNYSGLTKTTHFIISHEQRNKFELTFLKSVINQNIK